MNESFEETLKSLVASAKRLKKSFASISGGSARFDLSLEGEGIGVHLFPPRGALNSEGVRQKISETKPEPVQPTTGAVEAAKEIVEAGEDTPVKKKRHRRTKAQIAADKAKAEDDTANEPDPAEDTISDDPTPVEAKSDPVEAKEETPSEDDFLKDTGEDDDTLGDLSGEAAGTDDIFDDADDNSLEGLPEDFEGSPEAESEKVSETAGAGGDSSLDDLLEI